MITTDQTNNQIYEDLELCTSSIITHFAKVKNGATFDNLKKRLSNPPFSSEDLAESELFKRVVDSFVESGILYTKMVPKNQTMPLGHRIKKYFWNSTDEEFEEENKILANYNHGE